MHVGCVFRVGRVVLGTRQPAVLAHAVREAKGLTAARTCHAQLGRAARRQLASAAAAAQAPVEERVALEGHDGGASVVDGKVGGQRMPAHVFVQ